MSAVEWSRGFKSFEYLNSKTKFVRLVFDTITALTAIYVKIAVTQYDLIYTA